MSRAQLYNRIQSGALRVQKDGARTYVTWSELERYVQACDEPRQAGGLFPHCLHLPNPPNNPSATNRRPPPATPTGPPCPPRRNITASATCKPNTRVEFSKSAIVRANFRILKYP